MADYCSKIILDAHPTALNPLKIAADPDIQQLPPPPVWSAMVKGTLEYLRITWDSFAPKRPKLGIHVASGVKATSSICTEQPGDCNLSKVLKNLAKSYPSKGPVDPHNSRQNWWSSVLGNAMSSTTNTFSARKHTRIIMFLMSDDARSIESQITALNKDIVSTYVKTQNCYDRIDFNVVRICWEEQEQLLPDTHKKLLNDRINVYVHNVSVDMDDIVQSMRNLAQLHCSLKSVRITQIPMNKTSTIDLSTHQVTFLYRETELAEAEKSWPPSKRVFDPSFWDNRVEELVYVKRSKRPVQVDGWCTSITPLVPADLEYAPSDVYVKTTLGGSSSYLTTAEAPQESSSGQKTFTHTLVGDDGRLFLCKYEPVEDDSMMMLEFPVKEEGQVSFPADLKSERLLRDVVAPATTGNLHAQSTLVERDPLQYAPQASFYTLLRTYPSVTAAWSQEPAAKSRPKHKMTLFLEKSTKWLACFRDSVGTEEFSVEQDDRSVVDTAREVANGEPLSNGYEFILDLLPPMSDSLGEIWTFMMKDKIPNTEKGQIKAIISSTLEELWDVMEKRSIRNLARIDMHRDFSRELTAKRILVALCLVGWRFKNDSPSHRDVCEYMLSLIVEPKQQQQQQQQQQQEANAAMQQPGAQAATAPTDIAWQQANSYQNMTLQEQANAVYQDTLEEAPRQMLPTPQQQQQRGKRPRRWPDHTIIQPYLKSTPASKEEKELREKLEAQQIGPPGSALWYINTMKTLSLTGKRVSDDQQDDETVLIYKKGRWIRRQKEFDGYVAS